MPTPLRQTYQLKITLEHTKPPIWRRLLVPASLPLDDLHVVFQIAMGWTESHLHEFRKDQECWAERDPESPCRDERTQRLNKLVNREKEFFHYTYDFGDNWSHKITLEKVLPYDSKNPLPRCTKGARACPPEDCGGPWGYQHLLAVLADPAHADHDDMTEWLGDEELDPERFDIAEVNAILTETFRS